MEFNWSVVVLASSLPDAKVRGSVGPFDVKDQVLYEVDFVVSPDDLQQHK